MLASEKGDIVWEHLQYLILRVLVSEKGDIIWAFV